MSLAIVAIYRTKFKQSYTTINKKVYCSSEIYTLTDDGPRGVRNYLGTS